jgi:hypothetical protein
VTAALAARLVAQQGWNRLGFARLADYARERLGVSPRLLQEWAQVGATLDTLPGLEAALVSAQLPWSKVRLLARFVTPSDESRWITQAAGVSVRRLERSLRAVDRGAMETRVPERDEPGADVEPTRWVRLRVPAPLAFKWQRLRRYAEKVDGRPLAAGEVLERVTAEVVAGLPVTEDVDAQSVSGVIEAPWSRAPCDETATNSCALQSPVALDGVGPDGREELPAFLRPLIADLDAADPFELDARLRRVVRLQQRLDAQLAPLLRHLTSSEHEWKQRYVSLEALARECLGISPSKARALLRVERLGEVCPALREAFRDGALSWVQAQALARLLENDAEGDPKSDWRKTWVRFAQTVTVRRLIEAVERARLWRKANPAGFDQYRDVPEHFCDPDPDEARGERQTCARPTDVLGGVRLRISAPCDVARLFDAVLCTLRRAIERETGDLPSEADAFEAMLDHAVASWTVDDVWLRRRMSRKHYAVLERDDWRCVMAGCTSQRNLHVHHIEFRSAGGSDEADNLVTLCAFHHQRGVHGGTAAVRGRAPSHLEFDLGTRPGLPSLARFRSGDRVLA